MALLEMRRRGSGFLFVAVVLAHIILISAQVTSRTGTPVLQAVAFGLFAEVQRAGAAVVHAVGSVWSGYVDLRGVRAENARLRSDLDEARIRLQRERAASTRAAQLQALLDLRDRLELETLAAEIIAASPTPEFRTVTISKGRGDGLRPDMAVIAPAGAVGRVIVPSARAAKVQLLVDRNAAVGALVERTRAQGVILGQGDDRLRLDFVPGTAEVEVGDTVVTSGIDGIFPKGFVIGRVEHVDRSAGSYREIRVRPAIDFTSLEEVLVVLTPAAPPDELVGGPVS